MLPKVDPSRLGNLLYRYVMLILPKTINNVSQHEIISASYNYEALLSVFPGSTCFVGEWSARTKIIEVLMKFLLRSKKRDEANLVRKSLRIEVIRKKSLRGIVVENKEHLELIAGDRRALSEPRLDGVGAQRLASG
jgi:hypothetical protein